MTLSDWKVAVRPLGIPLVGEGVMMLSCLIPAWAYHDGTAMPMLLSALLTIVTGTEVTRPSR